MDKSTHIGDRHLRVMVLMGLGGGFAVELHGLLRTEMDAGETLGTVGAAKGFAVDNGDIVLRTDIPAYPTGDALVKIYCRREHGQRATLHGGNGAQGSSQPPPGIVAAVYPCGDVGGDTLQASGIAVELPHLVVGVAAEANGAVVGHTNLVAVGHLDTFGSQHPPHRPDGVARLRPTGDDDEDISLFGELEARHQLGHRTRRVEPITWEHKTYSPFL